MALQTQLSELPCTEEQIYKLIQKRTTEEEIEDKNKIEINDEIKNVENEKSSEAEKIEKSEDAE